MQSDVRVVFGWLYIYRRIASYDHSIIYCSNCHRLHLFHSFHHRRCRGMRYIEWIMKNLPPLPNTGNKKCIRNIYAVQVTSRAQSSLVYCCLRMYNYWASHKSFRSPRDVGDVIALIVELAANNTACIVPATVPVIARIRDQHGDSQESGQ